MVGGIGDVDGDGINDVAVGARNARGSEIRDGAVYIFFMRANDTARMYSKISRAATGGLASLGFDFDGIGRSITAMPVLNANSSAVFTLVIGDSIPDRVILVEIDS